MGKRKELEITEYKIKNIDPKSINWTHQYRGKFKIIYEKVRSLKIGEAISVECDSKNLGAMCRQYCYKRVKGVYVIRTKRSYNGKYWYIMKTAK